MNPEMILDTRELNHLFTLAHEKICDEIAKAELDICRHKHFRSAAIARPLILSGSDDRNKALESAKANLDNLRGLEKFVRRIRQTIAEKSAEEFAKEFKHCWSFQKEKQA